MRSLLRRALRSTELAFAVGLALARPAAAQTTVYEVLGDSSWDQLGTAVAGVGDADGDGVRDFAVGAPGDDASGTNAGTVWVFSGATGAVLHTLHGEGAGDAFGSAVAGAGDVDGDGRADVIVGAPGNDSNGSASGRAMVFSGLDGRVLRAFNGPATSARFGASVSTAGDVDGDGHADLLVGSQSAAVGVWVHSGSDGRVLFSFGSGDPSDNFGFAVHGGGDVNRDGWPDFVVGAPGDDGGGSQGGRVLILSGRDGTVLQQHVGAAGDYLGHAVAFLGDVDGDARADVAVGAPFSTAAGVDAGYVRVISGATAATLYRVDGLPGQQFGCALAPAGDVDGDGAPDLIAGARGADSPGGVGAGRAWVISGVDGVRLAVLDGARAGDELGSAVGGVGDLTGDGRPEVIAGAPADDPAGTSSGSARVVNAYLDCNGNGVHDGRELFDGASADCNANAIPDECDLGAGTSPDCDANGVPDECDLAAGTGLDCNGNAIPDVCDLDAGASADCDRNGVPDECDIASGTSPDCNANGVPDGCDVSRGTSTDCDADGVPDECRVPFPRFTDVSPTFDGPNAPLTHTHTIPVPPPAATDVTFTIVALGDLDASAENVAVWLNETLLGTVFTVVSASCVEASDELVVPESLFDALVAGGDAVIELVPSAVVTGCIEPHLRVTTEYGYVGTFDCNGNGTPDTCDVAAGTSQDANANGIPDECEFATYCEALPNSTGAPAQMAWGGSSSVSADDLVLLAAPLPALVNGLFVYAAGPASIPLGNGVLCLDPSVQGFVNRLPFETSSAAGTMLHALDLTSPPAPESLITPGSTWYFTCWFRDPAAGGAGFNFANGLRVVFQP